MLTCTLIQTALYWEDVAANLTMLQQKIASISDAKEMVILPEMFSTGFSMQPEVYAQPMDGTVVQWMQQIAMEKRIILCGSVMISENDCYYNRFIWMLPNGEYRYYNKRHLFTMGKEHMHYTKGDSTLIVPVKGFKINCQICYDLRFPVWSRQQGVLYDVLLYVANWPEKRSTAWKTLLVARAIENQCYVIGVNRVGTDGNGIYHSGNSLVVSPLGEVLYHKADEEDIYTFTLDSNTIKSVREKLPFLDDADIFEIKK